MAPDTARGDIMSLDQFKQWFISEMEWCPDEITEDDGAPLDPLSGEEDGQSADNLYAQAVAVVCRERKASTSFVQRHLQIGYNRAARIIERMETEGIVTPANHVGKREVLARGGE